MTPDQHALVRDLVAQYRPGHGLPRPFYTTPALYDLELDLFWRTGWLFAGHSCQAKEAGEWFTYDVGRPTSTTGSAASNVGLLERCPPTMSNTR